jgi:23S rRNA pseudouridine2605 synthase
MSAKRATRPQKPAAEAAEDALGERLQKVLAAAGLGSRRECEELIRQGRVEVDGQIVTQLGVRVDPYSQRIRADGETLTQPKRAYYLLNKPPGVVCTNQDPDGRVRVIDLIRTDERLFTVGRLDRSSEGLILATNDGELTNRLTHPRYGVEKVYRVRVAGHPPREIFEKLRQGIYLSDGVARVASIKTRRKQRDSTDLEVTLREGKNREIRRILARVGHRVLWLQRVAIGPIKLGNLPVGAYRKLTRDEVQQLEKASKPQTRRRSGKGGQPPKRKTAKSKSPPRGRRGVSHPPKKKTRGQGVVLSEGFDEAPAKKPAGKVQRKAARKRRR